jgi:hypothetical protein
MDNSFLFLSIGLMVVMLILASMVRVHPIFIPLFFIVWIFAIFISGVFSNSYGEMAANSELTIYANQLTMTSFMMRYLPFVVGIFGAILMIVMYKIWSNE